MKYLVSMIVTSIISVYAVPLNTIHVRIDFVGVPAVALKVITQSFGTVGYRLDPSFLDYRENKGILEGYLTGIRPLGAEQLNQVLHESDFDVSDGQVKEKNLFFKVNGTSGYWNATPLPADEGIELKKSASAQWFQVEGGQNIHIVPPYAGRWYPDIAVFDGRMNVLMEKRDTKGEEGLEIDLPQEAKYLKVSNLHGMKLLREGTWIESSSPGR